MFNAQGIVKPKRLEFEKDVKSENYGKFSVGPFERGYGVTTGNSLRRMLLSSIEGAAIVAIQIEGVFHEFSSIPGVVEDVTEIILNLKQVNLILADEAEEKRIYIKKSTQGKVYAKDIVADSQVTILNPDHHMQVFINFDEEPEPAKPEVDQAKQKMWTDLAKSVEELELSVRSYNCLKNANIQTIAELVQKTDSEMLRTRNFGRKSLNEIKEILENMELHLGVKLDEEDLKQVTQVKKKKEVDVEVDVDL